MKSLLTLVLALCAVLCHAQIRHLSWSTLPASPVYAGQPYVLQLTVETPAEQEITEIDVPGSLGQPEHKIELAGTNNTTRISQFRWTRHDAAPRTVRLPSQRVSMMLTVTQQFGFSRSTSSSVARENTPAFQYQVIDLPPEAAGLPVGEFRQSLTVSPSRIAPGSLTKVRYHIETLAGDLPADFTPPPLIDLHGGQAYPFDQVSAEGANQTFVAYYEAGPKVGTVRLQTAPLKAFDVMRRSVQEISPAAAPLEIQERVQEDEDNVVVSLDGAAKTPGLEVRFAPDAAAFPLGTVDRTHLQSLETWGDWTRVTDGKQTGWLRSRLLKEKPQQ